jgi:hypothetical protein
MAVPSTPRATVGPATPETVYEPVPFWAKVPHGIWLKEATSVAVASHSDIYAAKVSYVEVGSKLDPPRELVSLRKWRRVRG